jgi:hypothetical protein
VVWCVVWCGVVWRGVAWRSVVFCGAVWCGCGAAFGRPLPFPNRYLQNTCVPEDTRRVREGWPEKNKNNQDTHYFVKAKLIYIYIYLLIAMDIRGHPCISMHILGNHAYPWIPWISMHNRGEPNLQYYGVGRPSPSRHLKTSSSPATFNDRSPRL